MWQIQIKNAYFENGIDVLTLFDQGGIINPFKCFSKHA